MKALITLLLVFLAGLPAFPKTEGLWKSARVLTGLWGEECGDSPSGVCELRCGKANKKGIARVSLKITPFVGKKQTFKSVSVDTRGSGPVVVKWAKTYSVTIERDGRFFGEPIYGDSRPCCSPDAVWDSAVGGSVSGRHRLYVYAEEGTKDPIDLFESGMYCINMGLVGPFCWPDYDIWDGQAFTAKNRKWDFGKSPTLKYKWTHRSCGEWGDCSGYVLTGKSSSKPNFTATKLTYNPKTGIFKGSVVLYTDPVVCYDWGKKTKNTISLKKHKISIIGVWTDGGGVGFAISKKPAGNWPVFVE